MNSLLVLILAAAGIVLGYFVYARHIDRKVVQPDAKKATPARMYMDGVDFTPANRNVLFGYQFKSIAALGPITGPIIAVQWGWLPALAWVILGTFFIGWVQDYGAMMMGVRRDGETMGALSYKLISPRARKILMIFIYFYLLLIMGSFGNAVGKTLMTNPKNPLGMIIVVLMGILGGQMTYKWRRDIILTTVVTVVISFVGIWVSTLPGVAAFFTAVYGGAKCPVLFLGNTQAQVIGTLLVIVFCYLGSVLPIWSYAQPINYISFWIVSLGMLGGLIGLLDLAPRHGRLPGVHPVHHGLGPLWPILFVTIACGAISGWHSLVSTSGTARQLEKETDALPVGGGAMFMEMGFAVMAFLTATVAFGGLQGLPGRRRRGRGPGRLLQGPRGVPQRHPRAQGVWHGLRLGVPDHHGPDHHAAGRALHARGQRGAGGQAGAGHEEHPRGHHRGPDPDPGVRVGHPLADHLDRLRGRQPADGRAGPAADRPVGHVRRAASTPGRCTPRPS